MPKVNINCIDTIDINPTPTPAPKAQRAEARRHPREDRHKGHRLARRAKEAMRLVFTVAPEYHPSKANLKWALVGKL